MATARTKTRGKSLEIRKGIVIRNATKGDLDRILEIERA